ncbi:MAG: tetratricopeptide repeat protein [Alphaproteobacteria bacterium]|nr:tetratricopeptide repeat protein [Alphaproteobacteria bacterium]
MRSSLVIAAVPLILLGGCATASKTAQAPATPEPVVASSGYGKFLAGVGALNEGHDHLAAAFFNQARTEDPANGLVASHAFTAALMAGEVDKAAALAPTGEGVSEATARLGQLTVAVKDIIDGKGKEAHALLVGGTIGYPHLPAAALLAPWAAAEAGDVEGSLVRPDVSGDHVVGYFGELDQALLFERVHRYGEAETDFKAVNAAGVNDELATLMYGEFLERRGRRSQAIEVYDNGLALNPDSPALKMARARAAADRAPPPPPTVREGAAQALLAPTAVMLSAKQDGVALAYLRLILALDPNRDEGWVLLGDLLGAQGDVAGARAAYEEPKPDAPMYAAAQSKLAWSYQNAGDKEMALKIARQAAASGSVDGRMTLADLLRADERYAESADVLTGLISEQKKPDWRLLYARAAAYQETNRWPDAESDLKAALAQQPDNPELLNYLGYSWIDRNEHLGQAMAMVRRAVASDPRSGAMVDSLGWAYYRLGDYNTAVQKLEQAVELEAGDPEINDHLGDAYWKVGRKDEALFQWRRVLTLQPDDKTKADAEAKIASAEAPAPPQKLAEH